MHGEKNAHLCDRDGPRTGIHKQTSRLCILLYNVLHPRSILLLQKHQQLELRFPSLSLDDALFMWKLRKAGHSIFPSRVRRAHLSSRVIVDVINGILVRWPLRQKWTAFLTKLLCFSLLLWWFSSLWAGSRVINNSVRSTSNTSTSFIVTSSTSPSFAASFSSGND